jgi:murein DD-endopeptidase MepM/ murein hydrolase activator NlpD
MPGEDIKLQIGIDHAALEGEIDKALEVLGRGLSKPGGAAQSASSALASGGLEPIADSILASLGKQEALQRQLTRAYERLVALSEQEVRLAEKRGGRGSGGGGGGFFGALFGGGGSAPSGPGSATPTAGGAGATSSDVRGREERLDGVGGGGGYQPVTDSLGRQRRRDPKNRGWDYVHYGSRGEQALESYVQDGATDSSMIGLGADALGMIPDWRAQAGAAVLKAWRFDEKAEERWRMMRAQMFKEGGEDARVGLFSALSDTGGGSYTKYGLMGNEVAQLYRGMSGATGRFGTTEHKMDSGTYVSPGAQMRDVIELQGKMGLGSEAISSISALERAGVKADEQNLDVVGMALGLAMAQGLERGRFGEAFEQLTKAAGSISKGQADLSQIVLRQAFISELGPEMAGSTAARASMDATMQGLAGAQGGYAGYFSLMAAGFDGTNYYTAKMKGARGLGVDGGITVENLVATIGKTGITTKEKYLKGSEEYRNQVAWELGDMLHADPVNIKRMLDGWAGGAMDRAKAHDFAKEGKTRLKDEKLPGRDFDDQVAKSKVEQEGIFGGFGGGMDTRPTLEGLYGDGILGPGTNIGGVGMMKGATGTAADEAREMYSPASAAGAARHGPFESKADLAAAYGGGSADLSYSTTHRRKKQKKDGKYVDGDGLGEIHAKQDIYVAPGTWIYSPCSGKVGWVSQSMDSAAYGMTVEIQEIKADGKEGVLYRLTHLDADSVQVQSHQKIKKGDPIGRTVTTKTFREGGGPTHLDIGAFKDRAGYDRYRKSKHKADPDVSGVLNPLDAMGVDAANTMLGIGREEQIRRSSPKSSETPTSAPTPPPEGQGLTAPGSGAQGAAPRVTGHILVSVRDDRVSITQAAAKDARPGSPGQQALIPVRWT